MNRLTLYNRSTPFAEMNRMLGRMQRLMNPLLETDIDNEFAGINDSLAIDMHSNDKNIVVKAALPGFKEDEINVDVNKGILTISAERRSEKEEKDEERNWHYREMHYGSFTRSVRLPEDVQVDKAEAVLSEGILTLTLPREHPSPAQKIAVKARQLLKGGDK